MDRERAFDSDFGGVEPFEASLTRPRRRLRWIAAAVALVLVASLTATWLLRRAPEPIPTRVLVALETVTSDGEVGRWWGAQGTASAAFTDALREIGLQLGLDVLDVGDPAVLESVIDAEGDLGVAARALRAGALVRGRLVVTQRRALPVGEQAELRVELTLTVEGAGREATRIVGVGPLFRVSEAEDAALEALAKWLPERVATQVVAAIVAHPSLTLLAPEQAAAASETKFAQGAIKPAFELVARQTALLEERARDQETPRPNEERISRTDEDAAFVGETAEGRPVLLLERREVWLRANERELTVDETSDALEVVEAEGARRTLLEAHNLYSFPGMSRSGAHVAAVVDRFGRGQELLWLKTASPPEARVLLAVPKGHTLSSPLPTPDEAHVLHWRRSCRQCVASLDIVDVSGGPPRTLVPGGFQSMSLPTFAAGGGDAYALLRQTGDDPRHVVRIGLSGGPPSRVWPRELAPDAEVPLVRALAGDPSAARLLLVTNALDGSHHAPDLSLLDLGTGALTRVGSLDALDVVVSPDGRRVAATVGPEPGLVVLDVASGNRVAALELQPRTHLAGWSRKTDAVYLTVRGADPTDAQVSERAVVRFRWTQ